MCLMPPDWAAWRRQHGSTRQVHRVDSKAENRRSMCPLRTIGGWLVPFIEPIWAMTTKNTQSNKLRCSYPVCFTRRDIIWVHVAPFFRRTIYCELHLFLTSRICDQTLMSKYFVNRLRRASYSTIEPRSSASGLSLSGTIALMPMFACLTDDVAKLCRSQFASITYSILFQASPSNSLLHYPGLIMHAIRSSISPTIFRLLSNKCPSGS